MAQPSRYTAPRRRTATPTRNLDVPRQTPQADFGRRLDPARPRAGARAGGVVGVGKRAAARGKVGVVAALKSERAKLLRELRAVEKKIERANR